MKLIEFGVVGAETADTLLAKQPIANPPRLPEKPKAAPAKPALTSPGTRPPNGIDAREWTVYTSTLNMVAAGKGAEVYDQWLKDSIGVAKKLGQTTRATQLSQVLSTNIAAKAPKAAGTAVAKAASTAPAAHKPKGAAPTNPLAGSADQKAYYATMAKIKAGQMPSGSELQGASIVAAQLKHTKSLATLERYSTMNALGIQLVQMRNYANAVTALREGRLPNATQAIDASILSDKLQARTDLLGHVPAGISGPDWHHYLDVMKQIVRAQSDTAVPVAELKAAQDIAKRAGHAQVAKKLAIGIAKLSGPAAGPARKASVPSQAISKSEAAGKDPKRPLQPAGKFPNVTDEQYKNYASITAALKKDMNVAVSPTRLQHAQRVAKLYGHTETDDLVLARLKDAGIKPLGSAKPPTKAAPPKSSPVPAVPPALATEIAPALKQYATKPPAGVNITDWQRTLGIYSRALKNPKSVHPDEVEFAHAIFVQGKWPKADARLMAITKGPSPKAPPVPAGAPVAKKAPSGAPTAAKVAEVAIPAAVLAAIAPALRQYAKKPPKGVSPQDWSRALVISTRAGKGQDVPPEDLAFARQIFQHAGWKKTDTKLALVEKKQHGGSLLAKKEEKTPSITIKSPKIGPIPGLTKEETQFLVNVVNRLQKNRPVSLADLEKAHALSTKAKYGSTTTLLADAITSQKAIELAKARESETLRNEAIAKSKAAEEARKRKLAEADAAKKRAGVATTPVEKNQAIGQAQKAENDARAAQAVRDRELKTAKEHNKQLQASTPEVKHEVATNPQPPPPQPSPDDIHREPPTPPPSPTAPPPSPVALHPEPGAHSTEDRDAPMPLASLGPNVPGGGPGRGGPSADDSGPAGGPPGGHGGGPGGGPGSGPAGGPPPPPSPDSPPPPKDGHSLDNLLTAGGAGAAGAAAGYGVAKGMEKKPEAKKPEPAQPSDDAQPVQSGPTEASMTGGGGTMGVVLMGLGMAGAAIMALSKKKAAGTALGKLGPVSKKKGI